MLTGSVVYSIKYLRTGKIDFDTKSVELAKTGILFCILGLLTGMLWAKFTWSEWWSGDPKQNAAAICLLIYLAYLVFYAAMVLTVVSMVQYFSAAWGELTSED